MKSLPLIALFAIASMALAKAQIFDITFTGSESDATGQIVVDDGIAVSGYLTVTSGANQGTYSLVPLGSSLADGEPQGNAQTVVLSGGTDEIFDDIVTPNSDSFLTGNGLEFANDSSTGFNLWGNSPGSYSLFNGGGAQNVWIQDNGTATIVASPEPSTWALLLGGVALLGFFGAPRARRIRI